MKPPLMSLVAVVAAVALWISGCAQSTPTPAATKAPVAPVATAAPAKPAAAPTTAPAPAKAPAAPTTAAAAAKVDFPAKGKTISLVVAYPAGAPTDISARLLVDPLSKELGVPVQVINKGEAGGQVGATELVTSKPDGYTVGYVVIPTLITSYLDPQRKAVYSRKDFQPVAVQTGEPQFVGVRTDSPWKSLKDVIDATKASSGKVSIAVTGILAPPHLASLELQQMSGAKFTIVNFDGAPAGLTALMGGHVDVKIGVVSELASTSDKVRPVALLDQQEYKYAPGLTTAESQGYKGNYMTPVRGFVLPAGVPKEIVDIFAAAIKKSMQSDEYVKKMDAAKLPQRYLGPAEYGALWDSYESTAKSLMALLKQEQK